MEVRPIITVRKRVKRYAIKNADTYYTYSGYGNERKLTLLEYLKLLADITNLLIDWIFRNPGIDFILPHKLGAFGLRKGYTKYADKDSIIEPRIDLLSTKKYKKPIYFMNDHTRGEYFKMVWIKAGYAYFKNISAYKIRSLYLFGQKIKAFTKQGTPSKKIIQKI